MEPASLIGFGLALLLVGWMASAILGGAVLAGRAWLRRRGPEIERAAAAAAIVLPAILGGAVVLALLGRSLAIPVLGLDDHCPVHGHHPHLCLFHAAGWTQAWAVITVGIVGGLTLVRLGGLVRAQIAATRSLRHLGRAASPVLVDGERVLVVPSSRVFLFLGGIFRPAIYASSAAWETLDPIERRGVLAHERAHAEQADLRRHLLYSVLVLVGAPFIARRVLGSWASATERVCDRRAAAELGDPSPIAQALVALARRSIDQALPACAPFAAAGTELVLRVESLMGEAAPVKDAARLHRIALIAALGVVAVTLVFADPLHHLLETLLGMV